MASVTASLLQQSWSDRRKAATAGIAQAGFLGGYSTPPLLHRQYETRRTVDLEHASDGPIMDRHRRESRQHNGITLRGLSQPAFAISRISPERGEMSVK